MSKVPMLRMDGTSARKAFKQWCKVNSQLLPVNSWWPPSSAKFWRQMRYNIPFVLRGPYILDSEFRKKRDRYWRKRDGIRGKRRRD